MYLFMYHISFFIFRNSFAWDSQWKVFDYFVIIFVLATRPWGRVLAWSCSVADQRGSFILSARASTLGYMAAVIVENWKQLCIIPKSFNRWPLDYENEVLCFTYCFQNMPRGFLSSKPWEFSRYLNPFQRYTSSFLISFFFFLISLTFHAYLNFHFCENYTESTF